MDKAEEVDSEIGDVMYHSFGEGYATRCEDEGFGLIYAGKQAVRLEDHDQETETVDVMYHSFGEGYATRCKDEGFGLIYAGKQSIKDHDQEIVENHFAFETKESHIKKEKAQHRN
ncbi:uncharacterized protein LOC116187502 [Punica granatum]|nr:uncharacterized protein LOC116187502 [Punica granatum]